MIRGVRQLLMVLMLLSGIALYGAEDKPGWASRFNAWCCKNLGYGCGAPKATQTRGNDQVRPRGGDLMAFDLKEHAISAIWRDCACWSPVPYSPGNVAVASSTGIWLVPLDNPEKRKLLLAAMDVMELLGTDFMPDGSLLFLRSSASGECKFESWSLSPGNSSPVKSALSPELACGTDFDFYGITKPAQVSKSGSMKLMTLFRRGTYEIDMQSADSLKPLFADQSGESVDRFDPVWTGTSSIAFVTSR
jgi:hypothetical protein